MDTNSHVFQRLRRAIVFAGANEPKVENATGMQVLQTYHQTFIEAVRPPEGIMLADLNIQAHRQT
jgi:hypothetical protein